MKTIRRADASWTTTIEKQKEKPSHRCRTVLRMVPNSYSFVTYAIANISRTIVPTSLILPYYSVGELGVGRALRRLREFLVGGVGHVSTSGQHMLPKEVMEVQLTF